MAAMSDWRASRRHADLSISNCAWLKPGLFQLVTGGGRFVQPMSAALAIIHAPAVIARIAFPPLPLRSDFRSRLKDIRVLWYFCERQPDPTFSKMAALPKPQGPGRGRDGLTGTGGVGLAVVLGSPRAAPTAPRDQPRGAAYLIDRSVFAFDRGRAGAENRHRAIRYLGFEPIDHCPQFVRAHFV